MQRKHISPFERVPSRLSTSRAAESAITKLEFYIFFIFEKGNFIFDLLNF